MPWLSARLGWQVKNNQTKTHFSSKYFYESNMNLNIIQLKSKWAKENNSYLKQEVGSGVQKFVKDFLKSEDLFGLKEGLSSALLEKRKNEFTEVSKTKAARKADIIIAKK